MSRGMHPARLFNPHCTVGGSRVSIVGLLSVIVIFQVISSALALFVIRQQGQRIEHLAHMMSVHDDAIHVLMQPKGKVD